MPILPSNLRNRLERVVTEARDIAEAGSRAALESLAVHHYEPYAHMSPAERQLRNKLRAKARSLGDVQDRTGNLALRRLVAECAYEQWHRMLFARFLAENGLLILPSRGVSISLAEAEELASRDGVSVWEFVARCAQSMLPQIFRPEDPLLQVELAAEHQIRLRNLIDSLPAAVFTASDSLGWVYQYWQSKRKDEVNRSGDKVGADEIPAVTQLFTEPYMVQFLLHNTLGAWWAGKQLSQDDLTRATSEDELRRKIALPGVTWEYLRFVRAGSEGESPASWRIAAGTFNEWPKLAREIEVLDPCCGSGHFLVAAFHVLVPIRMAEEGLSARDAVDVVLRDNLYGLEIDNRCCQIAAFALALAAWSYPGSDGYRTLPELHVACSGLAARGKEDDWTNLAGADDRLRAGMHRLYNLFKEADTLGSLIDPGDPRQRLLFISAFEDLGPLLSRALGHEDVHLDVAQAETAIAAQGLAHAAGMLVRKYTLVATNVPYLARAKQVTVLADYCESWFPEAKGNLATSFLMRMGNWLEPGGALAVIAPQNWLFLRTQAQMRKRLLTGMTFNLLGAIGAKAFRTPLWDLKILAAVLTAVRPFPDSAISSVDASTASSVDRTAESLRGGPVGVLNQLAQLGNPDFRILLSGAMEGTLLERYAYAYHGLTTGDLPRMAICFWELPAIDLPWARFQSTVSALSCYGGREQLLRWGYGSGAIADIPGARKDGTAAWGKLGVAVSQMHSLLPTIYSGDAFDNNTAVILPNDSSHLPAIWAFCSSPQYAEQVRRIDKTLKVTNATLVNVAFDPEHWQRVANEKYPYGLPKPQSNDPTQWLFHGHPAGMVAAGPASRSPYCIADPVGTERHPSLIYRAPNTSDILQVAVARLLGYRWPAETVGDMELDEASRAWVEKCAELGKYADRDGIACMPSILGETPAHERLIELLHASGLPLDRLMEWTGGLGLEDWLRNTFFAEHCRLFRHRPFIWHIWDGRRRDGFHALVNYHRLCAPDGRGRQLLEKLTYSYLGDWLARQKDAVSRGEDGADDRLASATVLQNTLKAILVGEPPYDIFVRWKPLSRQPIGWEPDINDGVRVNIRPFMAHDLPNGVTGAGILRAKPNISWSKDRGKEPVRSKDEYPWLWGWDQTSVDFTGGPSNDGNRWNDCHYTVKLKQAARSSRGTSLGEAARP
ncbi:MAG: DNA methyltransferase [Bacillota bacterium]